MPLRSLNTLRTDLLYKNPYWEYKLDKYTLPDGTVGEYHYVHSRDSAMVIPINHDGKIILVKQFRYLWQRESIEFPSGGVKEGDALTTAKEELAEEANLAASNWRFIGEYNPYNGVTDEIASVFVATGLSHFERGQDASEEFEIVEVNISGFQVLIDRGEVWDGMTLAAWMLAKPAVCEYATRIK